MSTIDFNLKENWEQISKSVINLDLFESQWIYKWSTTELNASLIYNAVFLMKPEIIVETGTFEAVGTYVLAKAASDAKTKCKIYTFDYDADPITELPEKEWKKLREIRTNNLNKIRNSFPEIAIEYIDGDTRETLPIITGNQNFKWDFLFQDSMHFYEGVLAEWNILKRNANAKAVAVFDDISLTRQDFNQNGIEFCKFFIRSSEINFWDYINCEIGHHQFWIQKK